MLCSSSVAILLCAEWLSSLLCIVKHLAQLCRPHTSHAALACVITVEQAACHVMVGLIFVATTDFGISHQTLHQRLLLGV